MDAWLKGDFIRETGANVDQAERWMIDHHVRAAFRAKAADAQLAAFEFAEHVLPFGDPDLIRFPKREAGNRRAGIFPATVAMTKTHVDGVAGGFDFNCAAVTTSKMRS